MTRRKKQSKKQRRGFSWVFAFLMTLMLGVLAVGAIMAIAEKKLSSLVVSGLGERFSTTIYGKSPTSTALPVLAVISGTTKIKRDPINWEEIPTNVVNAVIAIEDHTFFSHHGLRLTSMARAALTNLKKHGAAQGGSTITQQLAKNYFLSPQKTIRRKLAEAGFALYLELRLTKEKILTLYLNHIYWGQEGSTSICGVRAAAHHYFNKDPQELSLAESAALAGIIRSPHRYNPFIDLISCRDRRDVVLKRMETLNLISEAGYRQAVKEKLIVDRQRNNNQNIEGNEYYVNEVIRKLYPTYGEGLFQEGYKIYTPCDPAMQLRAEQTVKKSRYQTAMVVMDPHTGRVLAMVGGRSYAESQYNRATQAHRQPGSIFKSFVVAAALQKNMTAATLILDQKRKFVVDKKTWKPANFENIYHGTVTVRQALAESMNLAILDLAMKTGLIEIIQVARRCGLNSYLGATPSVALGSYETSLLDITSAYAPFSNNGSQVTPILVESVQDAEDNILELHLPDIKPVLTEQQAFLMTSLLESVFTEGTAQHAKELGWNFPSAGKTGTTNDGRDAWFLGYTTNLLVGVWTGDDQAKAINVTGAKDALPLWIHFMKETYKETVPTAFVEPTGLIHKSLDPKSSELARSGCPDKMDEIFIQGTEPIIQCHLHPGGINGWFKKLFRPKQKQIKH